MKALSLCLLAALVLANVATAQLGGLYTINPIAPTGGTNYTALADAVNDLLTQGVAAPCIFEIFDDGGAQYCFFFGGGAFLREGRCAFSCRCACGVTGEAGSGLQGTARTSNSWSVRTK